MADIDIFYSGGIQNTEPNKSLGGFPSPTPVTINEKNNLFDDITAREATQGVTDYRCIYVFNDNLDLRYDITTYIEYTIEDGAAIQLGFLLQNAVQSIKFNTVPTSGTFTITVQGLRSGTITWDSDPAILAPRIQTALQEVTDCVVVVNSPGQHYYNITFKGVLGNKSLASLSITNNNLVPAVTPVIQQVTAGSPINTIASDIGFENISPTGVAFSTILSPGIRIGTLYPSEGFPVWIKRIVAARFEPVEGDGFILHTDPTGTLLE